jgi:hypothetical protein
MCKHARGPQFSSHRSIVGDDPRDARLCSQPGVEHEVPIYCHIEGRVPLARCIEPEAPCRLTKVEIQPRPLLRVQLHVTSRDGTFEPVRRRT